MAKEKECPCVDCICMPICRHKHFIDLTVECELIDNFTTDHENKPREVENMVITYNTLKPSRWEYF